MKKYIIAIICVCLAIVLIIAGVNKKEEQTNNEKIVTSFYPMYIIALNLTQGAQNIQLENMADNSVGCIHNYTLQTSDLKKIENAKIFIKNGFDLENFMDKIINTYPNLKIIDTQNAPLNIVEDEEGKNGHVWNNLENYKMQVQYISEKLQEQDKENAEIYKRNEQKYLEKLDALKPYKSLNKEYVISCNEALAYILDEAGFKTIDVYTDHDESSLSSGKIAEVVDLARKNNIKAIFVEKNDDLKNANIIANETGAKIVVLDANLTGTGTIDSYIKAMQDNYNKIRQIYGE